jgi:ribose 5-phosphate isomerase B
MKVIVGSDHAGFEAKTLAIAWLKAKGYEVDDAGAYSAESTDYPDHAHALSKKVDSGELPLGVLICGSANGVAMTANKYPNVRAAICWLPEIAALARQHNNANVCCLPARFISPEDQAAILDAFFSAQFEGGRHARRVDKIACL